MRNEPVSSGDPQKSAHKGEGSIYEPEEPEASRDSAARVKARPFLRANIVLYRNSELTIVSV